MTRAEVSVQLRAAERLIESGKWWDKRCRDRRLPLSVLAAERLQEALGLWIVLSADLTRRPKPSKNEHVSGNERPGSPAPGDVSVIDARHGIETFAAQYADVLVQRKVWTQVMLAGTLEQMAALIDHPGHFTSHPSEQLRGEFLADLKAVVEKASRVWDPDPARWIPIDVGCYEPGCDGVYEVEVPDAAAMDTLSDGDRKRRFKDSRPQARCSENHEHVIDAALAHHAAIEGMQ